MAIINYSHKFVFIHVPKAAGTSITKVLSEYTTLRDIEIGGTAFGEAIQPYYRDRFGVYKHITAHQLRSLVGAADWRGFYSFSFVRNPYSRIVSIYNFLRNWKECPQKTKESLSRFDDINDFISGYCLDREFGPDEIFRPQAFWLTDPSNRDKLIVSKVYKIESIEVAIKEIRKCIGVEPPTSNPVPQINVSRKEASVLELTDISRKKIESIYKRDFRLFGYDR